MVTAVDNFSCQISLHWNFLAGGGVTRTFPCTEISLHGGGGYKEISLQGNFPALKFLCTGEGEGEISLQSPPALASVSQTDSHSRNSISAAADKNFTHLQVNWRTPAASEQLNSLSRYLASRVTHMNTSKVKSGFTGASTLLVLPSETQEENTNGLSFSKHTHAVLKFVHPDLCCPRILVPDREHKAGHWSFRPGIMARFPLRRGRTWNQGFEHRRVATDDPWPSPWLPPRGCWEWEGGVQQITRKLLKLSPLRTTESLVRSDGCQEIFSRCHQWGDGGEIHSGECWLSLKLVRSHCHPPKPLRSHMMIRDRHHLTLLAV